MSDLPGLGPDPLEMAAGRRVLIVGSGALASLFAARLAATGVAVTMLGSWPEGLNALRSGVRLVEADGREEVYPVQVTADPADCAGIPAALVLVKAWQTAKAAEQLAGCLPLAGLALTLQNGWGNRELLEGALGRERVAAGVTTAGATLLGPGHVRVGGEGPITVGNHPRLATLAELLGQAGFTVTTVDDVDGLLWGKLVINAAINPLTALLQVPNGELLARPAVRELLARVAREAASVGTAQGFRLPFEDPVAAAEEVAARTAANHSSMLQDVLRGAPTEIDAICGAVVLAGRRLGMLAPINQALWVLVKAKAKRGA